MLPFEDALKRLNERSLARSLVSVAGTQGKWITVGSKQLTNFSSNDYLGLAQHPQVLDHATQVARRYGTGSGSSRLVSGNLDLHEALEQQLAGWKQSESCLLFSSGMLANVGVLTALGSPLLRRSEEGKRAVFLLDQYSHASLIDGVFLSASHNKTTWRRFKHNDLGHLEGLMNRHKGDPKIVATESLFSMEGDRAPIEDLVRLCRKTNSLLVVDEAHANGVLSEGDEASLSQFLREGRDDIVVTGTFGKALGSMGAYVLGSKSLASFLTNTARSFLYTTALPPFSVGAASKAIDLVRLNPNWGERLLDLSQLLQEKLAQHKIPFIGSGSQIVCVLTKTEERTLALAAFLRKKGFFAVGIRPPTVPKNKSRIRLSLTRHLTEDDVMELVFALRGFFEGSPQ